MITTILILLLTGAALIGLAPQLASGQLAADLRTIFNRARSHLRLYGELGGYVHDTNTSKFIAPNRAMLSAGTWSDVETAVADVWGRRRTAADATANIWIPIEIPSNGSAQKGAYLKSIDIWYDVATAAMDAVTATIFKVTLAANGAAFAAGASQTFTYDTGHDTAPERLTLDEHKMTLTITTPAWTDDDEYYFVELAIDAALTSVFTLLGARANYTLRL